MARQRVPRSRRDEGVWPEPRGRPFECKQDREYCGCGRLMIRTLERREYADRETGIFPMEAWHSCPRYFMPWWRWLLTLGTGGMGHSSHNEANSLLAREWR